MAISLLNKTEYKINDKVTALIPTLGDYRNDELRRDYDDLISLFLSTPSSYMVELYDMGRDFRQIKEYNFFIELFYGKYKYNIENDKLPDSTILLKGLDLNTLEIQETENGNLVLVDSKGEVIIDEYTYIQIGLLLCEILNTKKYKRKPANDTAYEYFIELEKEHRLNAKRRKRQSDNEFDELIIALVCDEGFPYDFETINQLTIYDFYCCVQQVVKRVNYHNLMRGVYSGFGTVDIKKIKKSELNFLSFR